MVRQKQTSRPRPKKPQNLAQNAQRMTAANARPNPPAVIPKTWPRPARMPVLEVLSNRTLLYKILQHLLAINRSYSAPNDALLALMRVRPVSRAFCIVARKLFDQADFRLRDSRSLDMLQRMLEIGVPLQLNLLDFSPATAMVSTTTERNSIFDLLKQSLNKLSLRALRIDLTSLDFTRFSQVASIQAKKKLDALYVTTIQMPVLHGTAPAPSRNTTAHACTSVHYRVPSGSILEAERLFVTTDVDPRYDHCLLSPLVAAANELTIIVPGGYYSFAHAAASATFGRFSRLHIIFAATPDDKLSLQRLKSILESGPLDSIEELAISFPSAKPIGSILDQHGPFARVSMPNLSRLVLIATGANDKVRVLATAATHLSTRRNWFDRAENLRFPRLGKLVVDASIAEKLSVRGLKLSSTVSLSLHAVPRATLSRFAFAGDPMFVLANEEPRRKFNART